MNTEWVVTEYQEKMAIFGILSFSGAWAVTILYELARGKNPYSLPDQERKAFLRAAFIASLEFAAIVLFYRFLLYTDFRKW